MDRYRASDPDNFIHIFLIALALVVVAALPRLYNLGDLSFYMDEETTSFASRAMAETGRPELPSGMPYYRAIPHSWMNSISAQILGLDNEISYRLPGALFGILTAPLLFLLARPYVGASVALLAALLLAVSEWHIIVSRQARMYAPFLFFYIAYTFTIMKWVQKDSIGYLVLSIALFIATVTLHNLGVLAALVPLVALFVTGYAKTAHYKLIIFSLAAGVSAYLYGEFFVIEPYQQWKALNGIATGKVDNNYFQLQEIAITGTAIAQGLIGMLLGTWLARSSGNTDYENGWQFRIFTRYLLAVCAGLFATTGHLHGLFLAFLLLLVLYPGSLRTFLQKAYRPLIAAGIIATLVSIGTIAVQGVHPGLKALLTFPYPNWFVLGDISPGITILFLATLIYLSVIIHRPENRNLLVLAVIGLFPIIIIGIFKKWAPARYLLEAYPFVLIIGAFGLKLLLHRVFQQLSKMRQPLVTGIMLVIGISGILGGHGLVRAYKAGTAVHGDTLNQAALVFDVYPDHKFPGEFVAAQRKDGDIVIAEDALVQKWYVGNIDYWLRNYESHEKFLYRDDKGKLHDIYVNSITATPDILNHLSTVKDTVVWIITTSETLQSREHYLNKVQREWLETIEENNEPIFIGKDRLTKVYCLNCRTDDMNNNAQP